MKKTKMKIISTIMALAMLISASPGAFAASFVETPSENEILIQFNGHGQYTKVASATRTSITRDANTQEIGRVVVATATDDDDLYFLSQDDYLLKVGTSDDQAETFLRVKRTDFDVENFSSNALDAFGFPAELVERISTIVDSQVAMNNDDFALSVFTPASHPALQAHNENANTRGTEQYWDEYYTRFGQQFTDSYIKFKNYSCPYSDNSSDAAEIAGEITSFLLECAGVASETVSAFSFGYSALKTLALALGVSEVTACNGYTAIQILVTYDAVYRLTYWNVVNGIGSDPYVATCKAWLNTNFTQQTHDAYPSGGFQTETLLDEEILSPHYDDPADWLYNDYYDAAGIIEGPIYHTIYDERFMLV